MTPRDTALLNGPAVLSPEAALERLCAVVGLPVDAAAADPGAGTPADPAFPLLDASWTYDAAADRLERLDAGAASLFGVPLHLLRAEPGRMARAVRSEDLPLLATLLAASADDLAAGRVLRIATPDGERRILVRARCERDEDGRLLRVHGVFSGADAARDRELSEERRRLATLIRSLPGMAFRIRNAPGWPVEFISEGCRDLIGWSPEDIVDSRRVSHADCVHPEDRDLVWRTMQAALAERRPYEVEYRVVARGGEVKWVWEQGVGVYHEGDLAAAEGFVCDISDRVRTHRALRESEVRYHELIESLPLGLAVLSRGPEGGFLVQDLNRAGEKLDGVAADAVRGRPAADISPMFRDPALQEALARVAETGSAENVPGVIYEGDRLLAWREHDLFRLQGGEVAVVFSDVTRRREAERALRLKQISIDGANDAMIWTVPSGAIIDCNERACELYAAAREDLLAASVFELNPAFTPQLWRRRWDDLRDDLSNNSEAVHRRLDGTTFAVQVSTRHLEYEGREYHCTVIRDLTEQKRHEAEIRRMREELELRVEERTRALSESRDQLLESEKMAALGRLVAGVTHEINTPVGIGVTAASHLQDLVRKVGDAYADRTMKRSDFESFLRDADQTAGMVLSNLNKASRLIQGFKGVAVDQSDDARREFDLKEYLEEILLSLRPRLKRSPVQVSLSCPEGVTVDSYPGALSQIVSNLVMNSLIHAFGDRAAGRISIVCEVVGDDVRLTYADDGQGMSGDVKAKLYEPFFTTKRGKGGSGLGMHVVYTAVNGMLDGRIACESSPGAGTEFRITFPRTRRRDDD